MMSATATALCIWFSAFAACLLVSACLAFGILLRRVGSGVVLTTAVLGALLCCLAGSEILPADAAAPSPSFAQQIAVLVGSAAVVAVQSSGVYWWLRSPSSRLRPMVTGVLVSIHLVATTATGAYYFRLAEGKVDELLDVGYDLQLEKIEHTVLVTDAGRELPVYRARELTNLATCDQRYADSHNGHLIRVTAPDEHSNCHGWVFTGGRFLLNGRDIDTILSDNGYEVTEQPRAGDVVIYRGPDGNPVHTGAVRGILDDGTPLIESKWGVGGRFLHRPLDQIYSAEYQYYHSPRRPDLSDSIERNIVVLRRVPPQPVAAATADTF